MLRPNLRSNSRHVNTPVPGTRLVDVSTAIADAGGDSTASPGIPTIQPSGLRGLHFPQLRETSHRQVDTDQDYWYKMQSQIEKDAPTLDNGILSKWKIFRALFMIYKKEHKGIQPMVDLISIKARQGLATHLKMGLADFLDLSDDSCMQKIDTHFKLENISNYRIILQKCHMEPVENHQVDSDKIQLYVEDFIDQIFKNPHFTDDTLRGAPPKVINDIFIAGFTPPAFREIVRHLGTTNITTTIELLPDLYAELDIYLRWLKIFGKPTIKSTSYDSGVVKQQITTGGKAIQCSNCLKFRPYQAQTHTIDKCYFLHPELAPEGWTNYAEKQPKLANLAITPKSTSNDGPEIMDLKAKIEDLESMLSFMGAINEEEQG